MEPSFSVHPFINLCLDNVRTCQGYSMTRLSRLMSSAKVDFFLVAIWLLAGSQLLPRRHFLWLPIVA